MRGIKSQIVAALSAAAITLGAAAPAFACDRYCPAESDIISTIVNIPAACAAVALLPDTLDGNKVVLYDATQLLSAHEIENLRSMALANNARLLGEKLSQKQVQVGSSVVGWSDYLNDNHVSGSLLGAQIVNSAGEVNGPQLVVYYVPSSSGHL